MTRSSDRRALIAIETSCDDTSVAIVRNREVLSLVVSSQPVHEKWGGIVPEFASRAHVGALPAMLQEALSQADLSYDDLDAVAVTNRPGLIGSLLVGLSAAKGIAVSRDLPLIGVDHLEAHLLSVMIENDVSFPYLALVVSGGHTLLTIVHGVGRYETIGETRDDAAGEAFDKGAKILGLGYPGGPEIDRLAQTGDRERFDFPRALRTDPTFDFSFSGLKTSLRYFVRDSYPDGNVSSTDLPDVCASYQEAIVDALAIKSFNALAHLELDRLAIVGGVSANSRLREVFQKRARQSNVSVMTTSLKYSTDNAAMIGLVGAMRLDEGAVDDLQLMARPKSNRIVISSDAS